MPTGQEKIATEKTFYYPQFLQEKAYHTTQGHTGKQAGGRQELGEIVS